MPSNVRSSILMLRYQWQRLPRQYGLLPCLLCVSVLAGCGGDSAQDRLDQAIPNRESVVPLSGVITVGGKPSADLMIRLVKEGASEPDRTSPKTVTDSNGKFEFTTYLAGDGVPAGKYAAIVEKMTRVGTSGWSGPDQLQNLFNHVKEPAATLEVKSGEPQTDVKIDLVTADKKPKPAPQYSSKGATGKPIKK